MLVAAGASEPAPWRWLALVVGCVFVAAAMLRLARFATFPAPDGGFLGLPMPAAAGAALALIIADPSPQLLLGGVLLTSALMVSEVPYPHPDGRMIPLLCGYWVAVAGALAGWLPIWPVVVAWLTVVPLVPLAASVRAHRHLLARVTGDWIRALDHAVGTIVHRQRVA
jgi:CDP-diacylglycerol--serine O-phosphatidyltransferase